MKMIIGKREKGEKPTAFLFYFSNWKHSYIHTFIPEYKIKYIPAEVHPKWITPVLKRYPNKVFIVWGYKDKEYLSYLGEKLGAPVFRMEDGFIRSHGLGSTFSTPLSMCLDKKGLYYNSRKSNDLEDILNTYPFEENQKLLARAKYCIDRLTELKVSKYNHVDSQDVKDIYGPKQKRRVLVLGQVEDDASISYGSKKKLTNNDVVRIAKFENPDSEIIYKPHPDVLSKRRKLYSDPNDVVSIANVIKTPLSLSDAFNTIDHVYTITSLGGFEALLRNIPVTTLGAPFYSGWGLTDDRQQTQRRTKKLSLEEVFAGAYIIYPRYVDPHSKKQIGIEKAMEHIIQGKMNN
ncbi:capsular polysaccharide export protein, LipB/KpsS family [Halobacillus litoralis]|nr:capsular polysaccharide biosynthesis protein [Halobacillus litoralis]